MPDLSRPRAPPDRAPLFTPVICLLFDYYGPYHFARLAGLRGAAQGWRVEGAQLRQASHDYRWQNTQDTPPVVTILSPEEERTSLPNRLRKVWNYLSATNPSAVAIAGYARPEMLAALAWCIARRRAAVLLSETKADDAQRNPRTELVKAFVVRRFSAALVGGSLHAAYLQRLGFPAGRIFTGYNVVGNDDYAPGVTRPLPPPAEGPYFLAVNRFIAKKNLPLLLRAFAEYRRDAGPSAWRLILCGDGPQRPELETLIDALGIREAVLLPGFLQQPEMLPYFAHAKVFVHASLVEQWGLVVNEAMAAGLPLLVSETCGCVPELVDPGKNGHTFPPGDQARLTQLLSEAAGGQWDLPAMRQCSLARIAQHSPQSFGIGLLAAVRSVGVHPCN